MADAKKTPPAKPVPKPAAKPVAKPVAKNGPKQAAKPAAKPVPKPTTPFVVKSLNDTSVKDTPLKEAVQLCAARFSPCGKFLAAGGMSGQILRWDATTDDFAPLPSLTGHGGFVDGLAFGPAGRMYTADSWGRLVAWNYADGGTKPLWEAAAAHDGWIRDIAVTPDGRTLATCGRDQLVRLWDAATGKQREELAGHVTDVFCVAFSPNGKLLASGDLFGNIKLWDPTTARLVRDVDAKPIAKLDRLQDVGGVRVLLFTPDGKHLLAGGTQPKNGGNVQGTPTLLEFEVAGGKQTKLQDYGTGHVYVCDVQYLADGTRLVALSGNPGVGKWLLERPGEAKPIYEYTKGGNCHALSLHPTQKRLAVTGINANNQGNGRVKGKNGEMDYPGNYSPVHVMEFPETNQTA